MIHLSWGGGRTAREPDNTAPAKGGVHYRVQGYSLCECADVCLCESLCVFFVCGSVFSCMGVGGVWVSSRLVFVVAYYQS